MNVPRQLKEVGLTNSEASVYYALIKLGPSSATHIMRRTGMYRANVYDALEKLMLKGLISDVVHKGRKEFSAADPSQLYKILGEKKKGLDEIMPELHTDFTAKKQLHEVRHFKGPEGIKAALREINEEKHYDAFGISSNLAKVVPHYFPHWIRERIEKKLTARMIKSEGDKLKTPELFGEKIYKKLFEVRDIPPKYFTRTATWILKEKVVIILESIESPLAIIIHNKEIRDDYYKQFMNMWASAAPEKLRP
ncbi:MAG: helix-turn-helix domain-containing protein [Nanoarchaeota archaeon]